MQPRTLVAIVVVAAALILFARAASVPLLDPDESRFARTSVEMLRSGDLVVPHFGGQPRLVKPPLLHWIQSFLFSLAGPTPLAARLPAIGATLGSILLLAGLATRRFGPEAGVWAAAVLATMPLVVVPGKVGTLDALLALHVLAIVALDLADDGGRAYRSLCTGALLGLAFLIKGPVGVILPLLVILAGRTVTRRELLPSSSALLRAAAAWTAVVLPWGLAFVRRVGFDSVVATLRGEVLDRYFSGTVHTEPVWFYAPVLALGLLPWLAPFGIGLVRVVVRHRDPAARTALYAAGGLVAGVAFFSLGQGKVATYVLPLLPLAAIVVVWELGQEIAAPARRGLGATLLAATAGAAAVLAALAAALRLDGPARSAAWIAAALLGVATLVGAYAAATRRPRATWATTAIGWGLVLLATVWTVFPEIGRTRSVEPLVQAVPQLTAGRPLVSVEVNVPGFAFYVGRPAEVLEMDQLAQRMARGDRPLFVLVDVDLPDVPPDLRGRLVEVGRHGKFVVFETRPRSLDAARPAS